jgi:hypothetical protein
MAPIRIAIDDPHVAVRIEHRRTVALAVRIGPLGGTHIVCGGDERCVLAVGDFVRVDGEGADLASTAHSFFRSKGDITAIDSPSCDDALIVKMRRIDALYRGVDAGRRRCAAAAKRNY